MAAKGYWVARLDISDPEKYQVYAAGVRRIMATRGARFIVRGGASESVEGAPRSRTVVIEFPDYQTALECYRSPEYAAAKKLRENINSADVVVVEGYDEPQPPEI
jgi:uncharacterized protein (DUF1330 family)